jgi:hypothetical protein
VIPARLKIIDGLYGSDNPLQTAELERTPNSGDGKPLSTCPRNENFLMEILNKIRGLRSEEKNYLFDMVHTAPSHTMLSFVVGFMHPSNLSVLLLYVTKCMYIFISVRHDNPSDLLDPSLALVFW